MMMKNSERFLNAFVNIEMLLKEKLKTNRYSFSKMVHLASKRFADVRHVREDLLEYAQLRNAIVHNRINKDEVIAEPHDKVVEHIEAIETFLSQAKSLEELSFPTVFTAETSDDLKRISEIQEAKNYSVVPVYDAKIYQGAIHARLYQRAYALSQGDLQTVEDVLQYDVYQDRIFFITKKMPIWNVLEFYMQEYEKGEALIALFVTETGSRKEKIEGILTHADIPLLMKYLNIPY